MRATRRRPYTNGRCWLLTLSSELQCQIMMRCRLVTKLVCTCRGLRAVSSTHETALWRAQLARHLTLAPRCSKALAYRRIFQLFVQSDDSPRCYEAQGITTSDAGQGEKRAWWKCTVVGLATEPELRLCVSYAGYADSENEWRLVEHLRPFRDTDEDNWWRRHPRMEGERVEVAWAITGHPVARWEAQIHSVQGSKVQVHYLGFEDSWREWLPHSSRRLFSPRPAQLQLESFWAH